ncbi:VOC family protein [Phytomonospora sp. NPDC050363]|uniref:VOC family protein n=1 Tax=Phytomonospora sp. NPDC050363 TaxID=3155642 RepID=UPI00340C6C78
MAARITELALDCLDPPRLARFWCEVLGYVVTSEAEDFIGIGPPEPADGQAPTMTFGPAAGPKREKLRLHIDLRPTDREQDAELDRLLALGARHADVGQGEDVDWYVLADPEDNEFCLLRRRALP